MNKADLKYRVDVVDDRIKVLIQKYPLVFTTCILGAVIF